MSHFLRTLILLGAAAVVALPACTVQEEFPPDSRTVQEILDGGVKVYGEIPQEDVESAIRFLLDRPELLQGKGILSVGPSDRPQHGEIEIFTGEVRGYLDGGGFIFILRRTADGWEVGHENIWIS